MFGSCASGGAHDQDGNENEDPRRPKRREGQRRELMVKQAERVPRRILVSNISEIEEQLSEDERDYEAKAARREEERLQKEEAIKKDAIAKAISGASGQLSGSLFSRMQGLAKLQEAARSALSSELGRLTTAAKEPGQGVSMDDTSVSTPGPLEMPIPGATWVVVKVTHPCTVALLRSKLSKNLATPLENVRLVHRHKALKDEDFVPDDTVDLGEQALAEDVLAENGAALSYVWMVDTSTLESNPPSSSSAAGVAKETLEKQKSSENSQKSMAGEASGEGDREPSEEDDLGGDREEKQDEKEKSGGEGCEEEEAAAAETKSSTQSKTQLLIEDEEPKGGEYALPPPDSENVFRRTSTRQEITTTTGSSAGGASKKREKRGLVPRLGIGGGALGAAGAGDVNLVEGVGEEEGGVAARAETKKRSKGRVVPGSLLLTSVSASDLPDTEKGVFSKQDPYIILKWGEQEARTTVRRDAGKKCSWPKEELALIVRKKAQLEEPVEVEVWNDNTGDKKPGPDVLVGKGCLPVKHLADGPPAAFGSGSGGAGDKGGTGGAVVTVRLLPGGKRRRRRKEKHAGLVSFTLLYTSPRRKPPKDKRIEEAGATGAGTGGAAAGERTVTTKRQAEDEAMSSIAGLSAWSGRDKRNSMSVQELGAVMSQTLEGFNIREELTKIDCLRYAQGFIVEGFGQRGAFANVREEQMAGHPMFVPRGARKRLLALSELIRLQMRAEEDNAKTFMDTIKREAAFEGRYTVDGRRFFDTLASMKETLAEEERLEAAAHMAQRTANTLTEDEDAPPQRKPPKPRTAAKEKVILAIEATAAAEERGVFKPAVYRAHTTERHAWQSAVCRAHTAEGQAWQSEGGDDGDEGPCCEKHAFRMKRGALHMLDERVQETSLKVNTWLDRADRFKNGSVPREAVTTAIRDAFHLNGLSSPRESDVRTSLDRVSNDSQGLQFDKGTLTLEIEQMIRAELMLRSGAP